MNERIVVNGEDLDLYPNSDIALSIRVNDVSDISTRNSTYSSTTKIPITSKNKRIFEFLGSSGSGSEVPYKKLRCRYFKNGVEIVKNGYIQVKKTKFENTYSIVIFEGIVDFAEAIGKKKIGQLNAATSYSHIRTMAKVVNSLSNEEGYIYAIQDNVNRKENDFIEFNKVIVDRMIPAFFSRTVFIAIIEEAGYNYEGEIFENEKLKQEVFTMEYGSIDSDIRFSKMFPKVTQADFIKDILVRYGVLMRLNGSTLEFRYFEDVISGGFGIKDFTNKVVDISEEDYDAGYAQSNLFTFDYKDSLNDEGNAYLSVFNENLKSEKQFYKSIFDYNRDFSIFGFTAGFSTVKAFNVPLVEIEVDADTGLDVFKALSNKSGIYEVDRTEADFQIKENSQANYVTITASEVLLKNDAVRWVNYLNENYGRFQRILNNFKRISVKLKLTSIDIHNLDLFSIIYLKQKAQYYYLNSLSLRNEFGVADMIQINGLADAGSGIELPDDVLIFISGVAIYQPDGVFQFTSGFITSYSIAGYIPVSLSISYIQLDSENGIPTGLEFYTEGISIDSPTQHNQVLPLFQENTCGWYRVQITDDNQGIVSNEVKVFMPCDDGVEPPSIELSGNFTTSEDSMNYEFKGFQPLTAAIGIRAYNFVTGAEGANASTTLTGITQDTKYTVPVNLPPSQSTWYEVILTTDTLTKTIITLI